MNTRGERDDSGRPTVALKITTVVLGLLVLSAGLVAVALAARHGTAWWQLALFAIAPFVGWAAFAVRTRIFADRRRVVAEGRESVAQVATWLLPFGLLALVVWLAWYNLRHVLETYQVHSSLGPDDAFPILGALSGGAAIATTVSVIVVRLMRGFGAMRKDSGAGTESSSKGRAEVIRAEAEARALVITAEAEAEATRLRARAELRRAETEHLRAISLPPTDGNQPPLGQGPSVNGDPGPAALPPGVGQPDTS